MIVNVELDWILQGSGRGPLEVLSQNRELEKKKTPISHYRHLTFRDDIIISHRWEDNIKMDLQEVGWGHGLDWAVSG
jgi:hypothetical protein